MKISKVFIWFYALLAVFVSLIIWSVWYDYKYPCVYGHTEKQWQIMYMDDGNGNMMPTNGYWQDVFVCDCRTVRDSIK